MPRDHPRIRGEHLRGRRREGRRAGIIPAYAGNTAPSSRIAHASPGSSPHTRGTPCRPCRSRAARWIIPAYAGNTTRRIQEVLGCPGSSPHTRGTRAGGHSRRLGRRDHPRIRGEHAALVWNLDGVIVGSSPHTRGTRKFINTRARNQRDHPRIRGEHALDHDVHAGRAGIIPAYAGNTLIYLRSQFPAWQFCITSSKATGLVSLACIAPA